MSLRSAVKKRRGRDRRMFPGRSRIIMIEILYPERRSCGGDCGVVRRVCVREQPPEGLMETARHQ